MVVYSFYSGSAADDAANESATITFFKLRCENVLFGSRDKLMEHYYFHQTPRVWLQGYAEDGSLLKGPEIFEDIMV